MKKIIFFVLLVICLPKAYCQTFEELPLDQQNRFFEGYWKYTSNNMDTILILKIKHFESQTGDVYIGSYLLKDHDTISGNITDMSEFLVFSSYEDYRTLKSVKFSQNKLKRWFSMFLLEDSASKICGYFYDYLKNHSYGEVTLEVISAQTGQERISWSLDLGEGVYHYPNDEDPNEYFSFSVPKNLVFTKIYDLTEFEICGIYLPPFPMQMEMIFPD